MDALIAQAAAQQRGGGGEITIPDKYVPPQHYMN